MYGSFFTTLVPAYCNNVPKEYQAEIDNFLTDYLFSCIFTNF